MLRYTLVWYREGETEGYALLYQDFNHPSAAVVVLDPTRELLVQTRKISDLEIILDLSRPCQRDREPVLLPIKGMPETLEDLNVVKTVYDI